MGEAFSKETIETINGGIGAPVGFHAAGAHAGFKKSQKRDLALIFSERQCSAAACYTTNKVQCDPIKVTKKHIADGKAQAVIVNSGYANTLSPGGIEIAERTCELVSEALGIKASDVAVASTGVIGKPPLIEPFEKFVPKLAKAVLTGDPESKYYGASHAADAIMTTDTFRKEAAVKFTLGGKECRIGGMAKGSGMINPNMATMLAFITTDVAISSKMLSTALKSDIPYSFNQVSVDGDTSTNDTVLLLANGMAENPSITEAKADFEVFCAALRVVTKSLARMLAKDGEGATKLIVCRVTGAPDEALARKIAKTVIQSDLVKTAVFGSDANWGRILCAVGYTPGKFSVDNASVILSSEAGTVTVCENSMALDFDETLAKAILDCDEILISVNLHDGEAAAEAYGCDLTYKYVKINGMYRT